MVKFSVGDRVRAIAGWASGKVGVVTDTELLSVRFDDLKVGLSYLQSPNALAFEDDFLQWVREVRSGQLTDSK